jgi:hypothetical protein
VRVTPGTGRIQLRHLSRYSTNARFADSHQIASSMLAAKHFALGGGVVFVLNGTVWNDCDRRPFNPSHMKRSFDRLSFALPFFQCLSQIYTGDMASSSSTLSGLDSIRISKAPHRKLKLSGTTAEGTPYVGSLLIDKETLIQSAQLIAASVVEFHQKLGIELLSLANAEQLKVFRQLNMAGDWERLSAGLGVE